MPYPTQRTLASDTTEATTGSSASVTPTGQQTDDWVIVAVGAAGGTGAITNTAGGLTKIGSDINAGNTIICALFKKKCGAGESGTTYTFESGSGANRRWTIDVTAWIDGDPTDIVEEAGTANTVNSNTVNAPSVDPLDTLRVHYISAWQRTAANVNGTFTEPTNYTKLRELYSGSSGATNSNYAPMVRELPNANATGLLAVNSDNTNWLAANSILLKGSSVSTVNLTPATMTLAGVAVNPVPQPVTVNLTVAALTFTGVAVNPVPGQVTVNLTPVVLTLSGIVLDPDPGQVTTNLTPATLTLDAIALDPDPGQVTVNLTVADLTFTAVPVDANAGQATVNLEPPVLSLVGVVVDPQPQPVTVNLTPVTLTFDAVSLTPQSAVNLTPASFVLTAVQVDPQPQPVTVVLTSATFTFTGVPVIPVPQPVTVNLVSASLTFTAVPFGAVGQVTLTAADITFTAVVLIPVPGLVTVNLVAAVLTIDAVPLSASGQSVVNLVPAVITFTAVSFGAPCPPDAIAFLTTPLVQAMLDDLPIQVSSIEPLFVQAVLDECS